MGLYASRGMIRVSCSYREGVDNNCLEAKGHRLVNLPFFLFLNDYHFPKEPTSRSKFIVIFTEESLISDKCFRS